MSAPPPVRLYEPVPGDRAAWWEDLRRVHGEVAPAELEPGVRAWLLLTYDINKYVLGQDAQFSRDPRHWRDMQDGTIPAGSGIRAAWKPRPMALFNDGAEHRRLSGALIEACARLNDHRTHAKIKEASGDLIDRFVAHGHADLVADYARPLPLMVMGSLFGLGRPQIAQIIDQTTRTWQGDPQAAVTMEQLLYQVVMAARQHRDESSLPTLLLDQGLSEIEAAAQLGLLLAAGVDPVTHTISAALHALLTDSEVASARHTLRVSETVNLLLARHSPLETMVARFPLQDMRMGNHTVRAGDCLVAGYASAAQDLYARSGSGLEQVAVNRAHLAWGAGAHRCPRYGQDLALALTETAITELLGRLPDMALARPIVPADLLDTVNYRGLRALPTRFSPQRPAPAPAVASPRPAECPVGHSAPPPRRRRGLRDLFRLW